MHLLLGLMVLISHAGVIDSIRGACVSHGQKTSPHEVIKGKSPECLGLQLNVKAALPIDKAAAIEVRSSSETLAVTKQTAGELTP
jgi:hypothetical protein